MYRFFAFFLIGVTTVGLQARSITFSGHTWAVRTSAGNAQGPGPNYFSDSEQNVWVDNLGRLHLRITKAKNRWECAEVIALTSIGYGTYRFYIDSAVADLDPNVVLGLFTWNDDPSFNHREIDIEFSRWGRKQGPNAQYVVQPFSSSSVLQFQMPSILQSTHSFVWQPHAVDFQSNRNLTSTPAEADVIKRWSGFSNIPIPGGENPRINLWLYGGSKPLNNRVAEVIINRVEFIPLQ